MISGLTADSLLEPPLGDSPVKVRKAAMHDIQPILDLINGYAANGIMLPRTEFELSENIRDFSVAYCGERLVGCGALHFYTPVTGEVRSLAVSPAERTHGIGQLLVQSLINEAEAYALDAIFAFTYVPGFFAKLGFQEVERGELPLKAWKDCLRCPKFNSCDEIAVMRVLALDRWASHHHLRHPAALPDPADSLYVQLPVLKPRSESTIPKKQ
jgi:amino-acid N-acetyltransferase